MSQHWVIVKTEFHHELTVARQIEAMGYDAWVPMEVRFHRLTSGKTKLRRIWEAPLMPTIAFAAVPSAVHGKLTSLRCYHSLHRPDAVSAPFLIAPEQIKVFQDMVGRENAIRRRLFQRAELGKKGNKSLKVKLGDEHALAILLKELFGLEVPEMQEAA